MQQVNVWYEHPIQGWVLWRSVPADTADLWKEYFEMVHAPTSMGAHLQARLLPLGMAINQQHARRTPDKLMNEYLLYRQERKKKLEEANYGLWPLVIRAAREWFFVRAHGVDQARKLVDVCARSDGMGPGIMFSSNWPGIEKIKAEAVELLSKPGLVWVTSKPHDVGAAVGTIDENAYIKVPVSAERKTIESGVLSSKALRGAVGLANKRGLVISLAPDLEVIGETSFKDQNNKKRRGVKVVYWYLVTYPSVDELRKVYPTGKF